MAPLTCILRRVQEISALRNNAAGVYSYSEVLQKDEEANLKHMEI